MTHPPSPLISVVIPLYNQAPFLQASLSSVQAQTYTHLEIILVNDGSTDETESICLSFTKQDPRIHYLAQPNQGPSAARNAGIAASKGSYICLLDGDDLMDPERIAKQLAAFESDPSIDIVYTALRLIDLEGNPIGEMHGEEIASENFLVQLLFRNVIPGPSTIMAKRMCLAENPYNETFVHAEDYELMTRLAHLYRFKYLDLPLTSYRRHGQNLSNDLTAHRLAELRVINQYPPNHIESIVDKTSLRQEEKELLKGKILFNQGHFKEALSFFNSLSTSIALFYAGNCHFKLNNLTAAYQAYEQALALDDTNAACQNNLGTLLALQAKWDAAQIRFEKALELRPGYLDATDNLAHLKASSFPGRMTWRELRKDLVPYQNL